MTFTPFDSAQLPRIPWKNGGGLTREITCQPAGSSVQDFQWRLSIADIAASGPFSPFPGIDRIITLLSGSGVHLHSTHAGVDHLLTTPWQPFAFSGDVALDCDLQGITCQDFNVMVRRSFGSAQISLLQHQHWALPGHGALLVCSGTWQIQLPDGHVHILATASADGAFWSDLPQGGSAMPCTADAQLLAITITPLVEKFLAS